MLNFTFRKGIIKVYSIEIEVRFYSEKAEELLQYYQLK